MLLTHLFHLVTDSWSQIDQNLCALRRNLTVFNSHVARANRKNLGPDSIDHDCPIREGQPHLDRRRSSCRWHILGKPCFHLWLRTNENCLMSRQWVFGSERLMDTLLLAPGITHTAEVPLSLVWRSFWEETICQSFPGAKGDDRLVDLCFEAHWRPHIIFLVESVVENVSDKVWVTKRGTIYGQ